MEQVYQPDAAKHFRAGETVFARRRQSGIDEERGRGNPMPRPRKSPLAQQGGATQVAHKNKKPRKKQTHGHQTVTELRIPDDTEIERRDAAARPVQDLPPTEAPETHKKILRAHCEMAGEQPPSEASRESVPPSPSGGDPQPNEFWGEGSAETPEAPSEPEAPPEEQPAKPTPQEVLQALFEAEKGTLPIPDPEAFLREVQHHIERGPALKNALGNAYRGLGMNLANSRQETREAIANVAIEAFTAQGAIARLMLVRLFRLRGPMSARAAGDILMTLMVSQAIIYVLVPEVFGIEPPPAPEREEGQA
jgi:hypothetical protein